MLWANYYWIGIVQIIAIIHALKTGRNNWIYLLIFLPLVGAIIYFVMEILPGLQHGSSFLDGTLFKSGASISDLEKQLRISDTFSSRSQLANAYASRKQYDKAIAMYESALKDNYVNDLETILQIARIHFLSEQFEQSNMYYARALVLSKQKFIRPDDEFWYALSLYKSGHKTEAEEAFKKHIQFHRTFDAMYYYGELLLSEGRTNEARAQFESIMDQRDLIPSHLRRFHSKYVRMARKALRGM